MTSSTAPTDFPRFCRVRQRFPRPQAGDVVADVERQLASLDLAKRIRPGDSIAVTAGSRGITDIPLILKAAVAYLRELGAEPFLVPAMGSHGGATSDGQLAILDGLGITEAACECPIRSSMEADLLFETPDGVSVYSDRHAHAADHVLLVGRVKPHTMLAGKFQSGLCKMLVIGLGKQVGAATLHSAMAAEPFDELVGAIVPSLVSELNVRGGLAILENAYDETARLEAVRPDDILSRELVLLEQATEWMPRLPFDEIDVLIVDEIGKDISGSSLDTNIVGRKFDDNKAVVGERPIVHRIVARSLTPASHGNALGVGVAEFITRRLFEQIDHDATRMNGITSGHLGAAKIPPVLETDRDAVREALASLPLVHPSEAKVVWIKNTLMLGEVACSEAFFDRARAREDLAVVDELAGIRFDKDGMLLPRG